MNYILKPDIGWIALNVTVFSSTHRFFIDHVTESLFRTQTIIGIRKRMIEYGNASSPGRMAEYEKFGG